MTTANASQVSHRPWSWTDSAPLWLLALGVVSALIYWRCFTVPFPLTAHYAQGHVDYAWLTQYRIEGTTTFMAAFGALFGLQWLAHRLIREESSLDAFLLVLAGHVVFSAVLLAMYPAAAVDIYDYYLYGRITLIHGGNPFIQPPGMFPQDPYLYLSPWSGEPSVYGPVWQLLSLVPTAVGGDDLFRALVAMKIAVIAGSFVTTLLIYLVLRWLAPCRAVAGAMFFGWNPLVLFETAGNGHNDSVMTAFMMIGVAALVMGPRWAALPSLAAAVLTKVPVVLLGPLVLLGLLRKRDLSAIAMGVAVSLGLAAVTYAPFWAGPATLSFLGRGHWFTASPATLLRELLRQSGLEFEAANQTATLMAACLFGVIYLISVVALVRTWSSKRDERDRSATDAPNSDREREWAPWLRAAFRVTLAYLVVAALWWHAWYLLMLVCFAAVLGDPALEARTNMFCFGGLLSYVVFKYVWWFWEPQGDYFQIMVVSVLAIFSLPTIHWLASLLDRFRREEPLRGRAG